jgi:hypothetical protein
MKKKGLDMLGSLYERINGKHEKMLIDSTDYLHDALKSKRESSQRVQML